MAKNNTSTITWIVIAVIIIIAILGYVLINQNKPAPVTNTQQNQNSAASTHNIDISNFAFSTTALTIKTGDTVVWTNKDSVSHTITSDTGNELSSKLLKTNDAYSHTFTTAGTFNYHCEVHPSMKASITVQ